MRYESKHEHGKSHDVNSPFGANTMKIVFGKRRTHRKKLILQKLLVLGNSCLRMKYSPDNKVFNDVLFIIFRNVFFTLYRCK